MLGAGDLGALPGMQVRVLSGERSRWEQLAFRCDPRKVGEATQTVRIHGAVGRRRNLPIDSISFVPDSARLPGDPARREAAEGVHMAGHGGARNRSGPAPSAMSARSDARNLKARQLAVLGYQGEIPRFPLAGSSDRELEVWGEAWRTPQASQWIRESWCQIQRFT